MAGFLYQTLIRTSSSLSSSPISPRIFLTSHRHRSNKSGKAQLIEVDLDSSKDDHDDGEMLSRIRKLEDVIHDIIVKRSAPDWLPFIPGSSYWVPPRPSSQLLPKKLTTDLLTREQSLSLSTVRGWPSSSFFIQGTSSKHPVPVELKVKVMVIKDSEYASQSEDEEG